MEGLGDIKHNLEAAIAQMRQQAADAADESAHLLETYAKGTRVFRDRTGFLRGSIKGTSVVGPDGAHIILSANKVYAPHVEFGHFSKRGTTRYSTRKGKATSMRVSDRAYGTAVQPRSYIWASVVDMQGNVIGIFKKRLSL